MKYLAFAMKVEIMVIGLMMMYFNQVVTSPPFMSGAAIFTIGLYLAIEGYFGREFSGCIFKKETPAPVKKGFFK